MSEDEHGPGPRAAVDLLNTVPSRDGQVIPAPAGKDGTRCLHDVVDDRVGILVLEDQSMASSGPAMKPSKDIATCQITLLMPPISLATVNAVVRAEGNAPSLPTARRKKGSTRTGGVASALCSSPE